MLKKLTKSNLKGEVKERSAEPVRCWHECKNYCIINGGGDIMVENSQWIFYYEL